MSTPVFGLVMADGSLLHAVSDSLFDGDHPTHRSSVSVVQLCRDCEVEPVIYGEWGSDELGEICAQDMSSMYDMDGYFSDYGPADSDPYDRELPPGVI